MNPAQIESAMLGTVDPIDSTHDKDSCDAGHLETIKSRLGFNESALDRCGTV